MKDTFLETLFPAFLEIRNEELREKAEGAMRLAMRTGGWTDETIRLAPVTLNWEGCDVSWVEHVTDVTGGCIEGYERLAKYYHRHNAEFDRDTVVAGALIHDIGKLTEFVISGNREPVHGENYELMRHPLFLIFGSTFSALPQSAVCTISCEDANAISSSSNTICSSTPSIYSPCTRSFPFRSI